MLAEKTLSQWIEYFLDEDELIPEPSDIENIMHLENQFVSLIKAKVRDNHVVRRTDSIPGWLDAKASEAGISLSKILQDALKELLDTKRP